MGRESDVDTVTRPRRGRPPLDAAQRREQRLAMSRAAVALFREQGVAATSGEQIARAAGVSVRTFWRAFRVKESCVEPLLTQTITAFEDVLRTWPHEVGLAEHLHDAYALDPVTSRSDLDAVLAVVRLSHHEPGVRAAWLVLAERAEPTFAQVLGARLGRPPDALEIRVRAAAMNAALRVATDDLARDAVGGLSPDAVGTHRDLLAEAFAAVAPDPQNPSTR